MTKQIDEIIDYHVIQMPPGYVFWWIDDDGEMFAPTPIIGWAYYRYRCYDAQRFFWAQHPITPEDASPTDNPYAIQFPDGRVHFPEERTVDDLEQAKQYAREHYNKITKTEQLR